MLHICTMMKELAEAIQYVHSQNLMHGDLKTLNVIRVDSRLRLIDLDAAAHIKKDNAGEFIEPKSTEVEFFAGAKFSSG